MKKELTAIKKIADNELKRMVSLNLRFIIIIMSSRATQSGQEEFTKRALNLSDKNKVDKIPKKIRRILIGITSKNHPWNLL